VRADYEDWLQPADQMRHDWTPRTREPGPLTEDDVREIRKALCPPYHADPLELANHFGISPSMVSQIRTRKVWKHIDPPPVGGSEAASLRLASFGNRIGKKARAAAARKAWGILNGGEDG
jgi:hypothetical protein